MDRISFRGLCGAGLALVFVVLVNAPIPAREMVVQKGPVEIDPLPFYTAVKVLGAHKKNSDSEQLASFATTLHIERGFNYTFYLCPDGTQSTASFDSRTLHLERTNGKPVTFEVLADIEPDGNCRQGCAIHLPCYQVNAKEIELVTGQQTYRLKRPANFRLNEIHQVDEAGKTVLRTWESPIDADVVGLSEDGKNLYVLTPIEGLVLELTGGQIRFKVRSKVKYLKGRDVSVSATDNKTHTTLQFTTKNTSIWIKYPTPCSPSA
ncbi:MAG: hypothetical protein HY774_07130 [Acidobacteria bacterium]|nr:hypothetical protein [Acidobacteriota bacterium]